MKKHILAAKNWVTGSTKRLVLVIGVLAIFAGLIGYGLLHKDEPVQQVVPDTTASNIDQIQSIKLDKNTPPDIAVLHYQELGVAFLDAKLFDSAIGAFKKALTYKKVDQKDSWRGLVRAYKGKNSEEGIPYAKQLLAVLTKHDQPMWYREIVELARYTHDDATANAYQAKLDAEASKTQGANEPVGPN